MAGDLLRPAKERIRKALGLHTASFGHKLMKTAVTFVLVDFAWIFFRAESMGSALQIIKSMLTTHNFLALANGGLYGAGLSRKNFSVLWISILILFAADFLKYKGYIVRDEIMKQDLWFRWLVYLAAVMGILIFGIWGGSYDAASFIYFQF